jgi:pyruvate/2-oxoglutarate dehydrogenase complex dihydrolipoamide dehydrogenase (E3) component
MKYDYHIIILGGGSAGLTIASGASSLGAKVALVEKEKMGGDCLNYGCIPSKSFLRSAHLAHDIANGAHFGLNVNPGQNDLQKVMSRVQGVISEIEPHDSKERFESLGVDVFMSDVEILDNHSVNFGGKIITGKTLVIATGSEPHVPDIPGLDAVSFHTNKTIFNEKRLPKQLLVLGGGPIGVELGQGFCHLGADVTIIERTSTLFRKDEPEVWPLMQKVLQRNSVNLEHSASVVSAAQEGDTIFLTLQQNGETKTISGDMLLIAAGRSPNSRGFGLESLGVEMGDNGFIRTNSRQQTSIKNIYAAGDVTGPYLFTHMAGTQGVKVISNALLHIPQKMNYALTPWTTFTKPEVAHVGYTEAQAKSDGVFTDTIFIDMAGNDRAKTDSTTDGFLKLVLGKKGRLIGATLVADKAGDKIPLASLAIAQKLKSNAFTSFIFSYPTEVEVFQRAALEKMKTSFKPWMNKIIKKLFL